MPSSPCGVHKVVSHRNEPRISPHASSHPVGTTQTRDASRFLIAECAWTNISPKVLPQTCRRDSVGTLQSRQSRNRDTVEQLPRFTKKSRAHPEPQKVKTSRTITLCGYSRWFSETSNRNKLDRPGGPCRSPSIRSTFSGSGSPTTLQRRPGEKRRHQVACMALEQEGLHGNACSA